MVPSESSTPGTIATPTLPTISETSSFWADLPVDDHCMTIGTCPFSRAASNSGYPKLLVPGGVNSAISRVFCNAFTPAGELINGFMSPSNQIPPMEANLFVHHQTAYPPLCHASATPCSGSPSPSQSRPDMNSATVAVLVPSLRRRQRVSVLCLEFLLVVLVLERGNVIE